jgi:hypothetical protein
MLRRKKLLKSKKIAPPELSREEKKYQKFLAEIGEKAKALKKKPSEWQREYKKNFPKKPYEGLSNTIESGGAKTSVFDTQWQKKYEDDPLMAEREAEALRQVELKKQHLMPAYNKGPIMYDPKKDLTQNDRRPKSY